jgi:hypothetical protein
MDRGRGRPSRGRGGRGGKRGADAFEKQKRPSTSRREDQESKELLERLTEMLPKHGEAYTSKAASPMFADFPLSRYTMTGLSKCSYISPTAIQVATIPHALAG